MIIELSAGNRDIIDHGTVLLYSEKGDFTMKITASDSFQFSLTVSFLEEKSEEQRIDTSVENNHIRLNCINFAAEGTGVTEPVELASADGKRIYIMFWSSLLGKEPGKERVRKVDYTIYREQ